MFSSIHTFFLSFKYAGDPIKCHLGKNNFPDNFVDNVCWIAGTYTEKYRMGDEKQGQAGKLDHLCDGSEVALVRLWNFFHCRVKNQSDYFLDNRLSSKIDMGLNLDAVLH